MSSAELPLSVRLRSLAEQMGTTYTETHWKECRDEILEAAGVIEMMDEEIGRPRGAVKPKDYTFKDHPHPPLMRCGPDCKQSRVQQSEGAAHEAACETCKLQDEAAQPGTRFHVGEDLRSVYMITNSGKRLPIIGSVDFIAAQWVRDTLQRAWDDGQCENGCGAEQSEGAPLEITEKLTKFGPGWRKVMAYYTDILDCIRETVGPGHAVTDGCPPGDPWHMVPRSVIDEMRGMFRAVISSDMKQAEGPVPISADAHDQMLSLLREYMKCEYEGCVTCIERLDHLLRAGGITVG